MHRLLCLPLTLFLVLGALAQAPAVDTQASPTVEIQPPPDVESLAPPVEPKEYSQLWVDESAVVTPEAIAATIAGIKKQQTDPQQIVVFIHGFDVKRNTSTAEFDDLASRLRKQFEPSQTRAAFAGIQWQSASEQSIFQLANVYWQKISVARSVGHGPARQLLFAIQEAFPKAQVSIMAHSMGCEIAAAAVVPEIEYADQIPFVPVFRDHQDVKLQMVALCGSDLDYDIWSKSRAQAESDHLRNQMLWQTVARYTGKNDKVLSARARLRGKAGGSAFPRMTVEQLDQTVGHRRIILDGEDISGSHAFRKYYDDVRLARMVPVMLYLADSKRPKPREIAELDEILAAPNKLEALLPFLDSGRYGTLFYTLWRIERLNCGDARHMADGTLEAVGRLIKDTPKMIWRQQDKTECITIKNGDFPTERMMTRAGAPPRSKKK